MRNNITFAIPSVHRDIRIKLLDESYSLIKTLLYATYNKGNIRSKYINDLIVNISMLDFILDEYKEIDEV